MKAGGLCNGAARATIAWMGGPPTCPLLSSWSEDRGKGKASRKTIPCKFLKYLKMFVLQDPN